MVKPIHIRFEYLSSPAIGIGNISPRISWRYVFTDADTDRNWVQAAYEIEIRRCDGINVFSVHSSRSVFVPWPDRPLSPGEKALLRVRATGTNGVVSEWSEIATVRAGLYDAKGWRAALVEPAGSYVKGPPHRPAVFKRVFSLVEDAKEAILSITAHGVYVVKINGKRVGNLVLAPGWTSYGNRLVYQTFEAEAFLNKGENTIEVDVAEGWYCGRLAFDTGKWNCYGDSIGLIAQLDIITKAGKTVSISTDDEWKWAYSPTLAAGIYDGETYDVRAEISSSTTWDVVRSSEVSDVLMAPEGPPITPTQELSPAAILRSPSGKVIIDMGQNMVGWLRVRVNGPADTTITFTHVEVLQDGEIVTRTLRSAKALDRLTLSGNGPITWEPQFTFHGFRYVQVDGWPGTLTVSDITGVVVHSNMERTGTFNCSHSLLNKLYQNATWSMRGNFVGIPTDCPQRDERLGWTGDINVFAPTANFLFDTTGMLVSWLRDLAVEQAEHGGLVPLTIPSVLEGLAQDAHAVWGDVAVMLPWSIYQASGDVEILRRQYPSMKAWLDAIPRRSNGLWNYKSGWKLGDWLDPAAPPNDPSAATTDPTLVSDAFLVHIARIMREVALLTGHETDAVEFDVEATKLTNAFAFEYITPAGLMVGDTQTAFALAINFGLFPTEAQERVAAERLKYIVFNKSRFKIATGFAGTPFVGHALTKMGLSDVFYRMLLETGCPSWLYPVSMGATTIWERWDSMLPDGTINPGDMTSFNHYALGAVAHWMHSVIGGLRIDEPGWKKFRIEPIPGGGLTWAETKYLSPYGECSVRWEIKGKDGGQILWVTATVPPNSSASVKLPGAVEDEEIGSGVYTWEVGI